MPLANEIIKLEIEVDSSQAEEVIARLKGEGVNVVIDVDDSAVQDVEQKLDGIEDEQVLIDVELSGDSIPKIESQLDGIKDESVEVDVELSGDSIPKIERKLQGIEDEKVNVDVDIDDVQLSLLAGKIAAGLAIGGIGSVIFESLNDEVENFRFAKAFDIDPEEQSSLLATYKELGLDVGDLFGTQLGIATDRALALQGDEDALRGFRLLGISPEQLRQLDLAGVVKAVVDGLGAEIDAQEFDALRLIGVGEEDARFLGQVTGKVYVEGWAESISEEELIKAEQMKKEWDKVKAEAAKAGKEAAIFFWDNFGTIEESEEAIERSTKKMILTVLQEMDRQGEEIPEKWKKLLEDPYSDVVERINERTIEVTGLSVQHWEDAYGAIRDDTEETGNTVVYTLDELKNKHKEVADSATADARRAAREIESIWDDHLQTMIDIINGKRPLLQSAWDQYAAIIGIGYPGQVGGVVGNVNDGNDRSPTRSTQTDYPRDVLT